jgi:aryl-alcohol dehydrogenase (NADP+)
MTFGSSSWRPWVLDEEASQPFFERALAAGINFFDTADMYSLGVSEEIVGRAIRRLTSRDRVVIATKAYFPLRDGPNDRGLSRKHLLDAIDDSLRRLGTDYVDLYQIHRFDQETPVEETLAALHDIVRSGRARYLGASSMAVWEFAKLQYTAERNGWTKFISMQNHYNLVYREEEREMIPFCLDQGVGLIPWSPLARGFLAGRHRDAAANESVRAKTDAFARRLYYTDADFVVADRVRQVASRLGASPAQVSLAWLLSKPAVTAPIVGFSRLEQLDDALGAVGLSLSPEDIAALEEPYTPHPVLGIS